MKDLPSNYLKNELTDLYGSVKHGYLSVNCRDTKTGSWSSAAWFSAADLANMHAFALNKADKYHVYHSAHVLREIPKSGRGTAADFCASVGVFLDIDIKQSDARAHAANDSLPPSLEDVLELFETHSLPMPTRIVNSGNGYYFWYMFDEVIEYPSEEEREAFIRASKAFHGKFASAFKSKGWKLDNVSDLARITRVIGTLNHKTTPPKPVELVEHTQERAFASQEFLALGMTPALAHPVNALPSVSNMACPDNISENRFDSIVAACAWAKSLVEGSSNLPYPEWFSLAGLLKHCKQGRELFHEISSADDRYQSDETEKVFSDAKGPIKCETVACETGGQFCGSCPALYNRHVGSPVAFGHVVPHEAALMTRYIYANKREQFFDVPSKVAWSKGNIDDFYTRYLKGPAKTLIGSRLVTQTETAAYVPGAHDPILSTNEGLVFNLWRASDLEPIAGDCSLILNHFEYLIPEVEEREHVLNVLAHAIQRPSEKIKHCILLVGGQGTGKSWILRLMERLFGPHNVAVEQNQYLSSNFNAQMGDKQVLILEEVGQEDRAETYNKLKVWITEESAKVEEKFVPAYRALTPRLMIALTNRDLPIKVEADDRRFMFIDSARTPREPKYYTQLFSVGLDQAGAFLRLLMDRDISKFCASAHPPSTALKQDIVDASRPAIEQEIRRMIPQKEYPFDQELFTIRALEIELRQRVSSRANFSSNEIARALRKLGYENLPQVRVANSTYRLWVLSGSSWTTASPEDIRSYVNSNPIMY